MEKAKVRSRQSVKKGGGQEEDLRYCLRIDGALF